MWNPFRSKLAAAILGGVDKIHIKPGSKVLYLGAASGTTVSHVADIVGPVSPLMCENVAMQLHPLPPSPCVRKNVATHPFYLILQFISVSNSLHSPHYHFIPSPLYPIPSHPIPFTPSLLTNHHSPSSHQHFTPSSFTHQHSTISPNHSSPTSPFILSPFTPSPHHHFTSSPLHLITTSPHHHFTISSNHSSPSTHSLTHRRVWCMLWSSLTAQGGT